MCGNFFKHGPGKVLASVAPIALGVLVPGLGTAIGAGIGLSGTAASVAGNALLGAGTSFLTGGNPVVGAVTGGAGGFIGSGGLSNVLGTAPSGAAGVYGSLTNVPGSVSSLGNAASAITGGGNFGAGILGSGNVLSSVLGNAGSLGGNPLLSLANAGASLYSANAGQQAAKDAAAAQTASVDKAIKAQQKALAQVQGNLQPYVDTGASSLQGLQQLVNDPNAQAAYIQSNPFYTALADDAQKRLFANQAAKGKLGSGGTAKALQNSLLLLGNDLLNQNIAQRQNLATLGQNAAAGVGTAIQNTGSNISDLYTQQGNAQAAGTIGGYNALTGSINNGLNTQALLYGLRV